MLSRILLTLLALACVHCRDSGSPLPLDAGADSSLPGEVEGGLPEFLDRHRHVFEGDDARQIDVAPGAIDPAEEWTLPRRSLLHSLPATHPHSSPLSPSTQTTIQVMVKGLKIWITLSFILALV